MMKNIFDFMIAALPWIAVGLMLAVFFARAAHRKKEKPESVKFSNRNHQKQL